MLWTLLGQRRSGCTYLHFGRVPVSVSERVRPYIVVHMYAHSIWSLWCLVRSHIHTLVRVYSFRFSTPDACTGHSHFIIHPPLYCTYSFELPTTMMLVTDIKSLESIFGFFSYLTSVFVGPTGNSPNAKTIYHIPIQFHNDSKTGYSQLVNVNVARRQLRRQRTLCWYK